MINDVVKNKEIESEDIKKVRHYHRVTKHSPNAYAPSPGFLDWDSQPNPYRRYQGAPLIKLPLVSNQATTEYETLCEEKIKPQVLTLETVSIFLELALGLSAWKSMGADCWALRHNPSSGNLHPTEAYLILWQNIDKDLRPGVYHYAPYEHGLERRAVLSQATANTLAQQIPDRFGAIGFSSIHWREQWKYGARALRYCQHDVGHALGCVCYSAAALGWHIVVDTAVTDAVICQCLGIQQEHTQTEPESPDLLAFIGYKKDKPPIDSVQFWQTLIKGLSSWQGRANQLSDESVSWPQITQVLPALEKTQATASDQNNLVQTINLPAINKRANKTAQALIRERRSAQRMVRGEGIGQQDFLQILARTMPGQLPFNAFGYQPAINLLLFIHAVEQIPAGLYFLARTQNSLGELQAACTNTSLLWQAVEHIYLPLYTLISPQDLRKTAAQLSCFQAIAGHSAFSLAMLADMGLTLKNEGAWAYRRLFWEAGLIGQTLYLEAGASDQTGTGIGCYFDDDVHQLLGLEDEGRWQNLYHFTIGTAREDHRLTTQPGYYRLKNQYNI